MSPHVPQMGNEKLAEFLIYMFTDLLQDYDGYVQALTISNIKVEEESARTIERVNIRQRAARGRDVTAFAAYCTSKWSLVT